MADPFQSCKLRHFVTIQEATETANSYGEIERTWATFKKRWANIRPLSGRERWAAQQVQANLSHEVLIRYTKDVTPKMRISYNSRTFEIGTVINVDERGAWMRLLCTEEV